MVDVFFKTNKRGCLNIFTGCFFFVNPNYLFSYHTIVLICFKTINYLIIQYLYGYFSATIKNVWSELSGEFIASCCGDSRRVQFTKKNNNNDDLRNFIGSLNVSGFSVVMSESIYWFMNLLCIQVSRSYVYLQTTVNHRNTNTQC